MQKQLSWFVLEKDILNSSIVHRGVGILVFLTLTMAGAFIYLPLSITPVPITLQTFFVLLCAAYLKRKDGLITQGTYLSFGALGLPIFSGATGGLLRLFGPTGGYLVGFAVCIYVVSVLLDNFKNKNQLTFSTILFSFTIGVAVIYLCGASWLAFITKLPFIEIMNLAVVPFIPGCVLKVMFAAIIFHKSNSRMRNIFKV